jgi:hypothetical protein
MTSAHSRTTTASGPVKGRPRPMYRFGMSMITLIARTIVSRASRISTYDSHQTSPPKRSVIDWSIRMM